MAIMIQASQRGTDLKKQVRKAAHILNKKIKIALYISMLGNIVMGYLLYKLRINN